ncbi:MAG: redoxin domain-containing protein [Gemmatimonadaceae bacterium]|nr:redoxin domain-containing protein [Gemmatimonadaceae bacterium]
MNEKGSLAVLCSATLGAQAAPMLGPIDGKDLPPTEIERVTMGATAPDFTLAKFGGGTATLSSLGGKKNVDLVFYHGYWCPFCGPHSRSCARCSMSRSRRKRNC